jgi:D-alanyl-lipoteichoic acid acyltransferase DltB (MBOAT superfamily)
MEITKYLCEFFFSNFWHWLGLLLIVGSLFHGVFSINIKGNNKKNNNGYE